MLPGPLTGARSRVPAGGGTAGPTTPRGTPITFERQETSKRRLETEWDFPVPAVSEVQELERGVAFARIRGNDPRPLLILRECNLCKGRDDALLYRALSNDKTSILLRWFHCVKLPPHVTEASHPFHSLFAGERAPHFYLLDPDGAHGVSFDGTQTQSDLQDGMVEVLRRSYQRDPEQAAKDLVKLLDHFDHLDSLKVSYTGQLDAAIEKQGKDSGDAKNARAKLEKVEFQMREALAREQQLADLKLKPPAAATAEGAKAEAGAAEAPRKG